MRTHYYKGSTRTFKQIFTEDAFDQEVENEYNFRWWYQHCGFPQLIITKPDTGIDYLELLYTALLSKYGERHIRSSSESRFRLEVMRLINQYGPLWQKQLQMQDEIRQLTIEDITTGSKMLTAHSFNDSTEVSIEDALSNEIPLNEVNTTVWAKNPAEAYANILELLDTDPTEQLLGRFEKLFGRVCGARVVMWLDDEEDCDEE